MIRDTEMCGVPPPPEMLATAIAVKITCPVLRTELIGDDPEIWLAFDEKFKSGDKIPVYFPDEIALMKNFTPDQVFKAHAIMIAFLGARIRE